MSSYKEVKKGYIHLLYTKNKPQSIVERCAVGQDASTIQWFGEVRNVFFLFFFIFFYFFFFFRFNLYCGRPYVRDRDKQVNTGVSYVCMC